MRCLFEIYVGMTSRQLDLEYRQEVWLRLGIIKIPWRHLGRRCSKHLKSVIHLVLTTPKVNSEDYHPLFPRLGDRGTERRSSLLKSGR